MFLKTALISFTVMVSIILPFTYYHYQKTYDTADEIRKSNMQRVVTHVLSKSKSQLSNSQWASLKDFCLDKNFELQEFLNDEQKCSNDFLGGVNKIVFERGKSIYVYDVEGLKGNSPTTIIPISAE